MPDHIYNVLFICTGNSARSIMAEAVLNKIGKGKFRAFSAGSKPKGQLNPHTIELLEGLGYDISGYRSKSWEEFAQPGAPEFDFIFTVCDDAAGETCPVLPGTPMTAHWGVLDPAAITGEPVEVAKAFREAFHLLASRIEVFAELPFASLDKIALHSKVHEIGRMQGASAKAKTGA